MKLCLISSSGGHYEQLMKLKPLLEENEGIIVTEKTLIGNKADYYLPQVNRKEILMIFKLLYGFIVSAYILIKEKPNVIISTGALCCIPMCLLGKILKKKVIFIESFAKVNSATLTGKLLYKFADKFIVQWEEMKEVYPNAEFGGSIY